MKHFAEMEMLRRRSEKNLRAYSAREKMQEKEDHDKVSWLFSYFKKVYPSFFIFVFRFRMILVSVLVGTTFVNLCVEIMQSNNH